MSYLSATAELTHMPLPNSWWHGQRLFALLLLLSFVLHLAALLEFGVRQEGSEANSSPPRQQSIAVTLQRLQPVPIKSAPAESATTAEVTKAKAPQPTAPGQKAHEPDSQNSPTEVANKEPRTAATTNTDSAAAAPAPLTTANDSAAREQSYLALVRSLIESHKFYPEMARRRGMQGVVRVSFLVHPDGSISDIACTGATLLLHAAAEAALRDAAPFPAALFPGDHPLEVHYEMAFRLK